MGMMLFPFHWGLEIASNIKQSVVKVMLCQFISLLLIPRLSRFRANESHIKTNPKVPTENAA